MVHLLHNGLVPWVLQASGLSLGYLLTLFAIAGNTVTPVVNKAAVQVEAVYIVSVLITVRH